ncbi:MAG: SPFH domain-containing protein [Peptoanaerobacter stomatis]|uniref:SPFH domain-containing protein n=1 Tax=Peptoanaerobacter stomatis TaxID=796937 RepID=UPI003F9FB799
MGLIKAGLGALGGTMADQWKEFFYCDSIPNDVLVVKGEKRIGGRSSNKKGSDNIISQGSGIAVADGQCMMIVEQGKVVEFCAEPGEFTFDSSTEPSIFNGSLGEGIKKTFETVGKRFAYGGDTGKDQRVYYFNMKELLDNKFGTQNPVPFRVVDRNIGLDVDISVRCNGVYSYKITNPMLFYANVCGNVENQYDRSEIDGQLKSEFLNALQPSFAKISEMGIRYSALPGHTMELSDAMNEILTPKWSELRGISIVSVGINSITAPKEDEDMIKQLQRTAVMRDPNMAAATLVGAQSDAMRAAASNEGGAMMGFMGMGMAQQAGGMNAQNLFQMGQQQQMQQQQMQQQQMQQQQQPQQPQMQRPYPQPPKDTWTCSCGTVNTGKFCVECASPKPQANVDGWTCSCGAINKGKFCSECGIPKPAGAPLYKCDKCGWEPEDPTKPPKFCPECGDVFDENDIK